jgi:hypothetical protein
MKQQTAVDWLYNILCDKGYFKKLPVSEFKEALQMEKEQKIEAYLQGSFDDGPNLSAAEQYYNRTYGQGSNDTNTK